MAAHLNGKTALVTGALGSGIGRSIAYVLARCGANIILNYRNPSDKKQIKKREQDASELMQQIQSLGVSADIIVGDMSVLNDVERAGKDIESRFNGIDILINNAGAPWMEQDFLEVTSERLVNTINTELIGAFRLTQLAVKSMREKRWGRIINICIDVRSLEILIDKIYGSSIKDMPLPFVLGKQARESMGRLLSKSELKYGITINNILPGIVEELDLESAFQLSAKESYDDRVAVSPDDVARIVKFLCGDDGRSVSGSSIYVPGNLFSRL